MNEADIPIDIHVSKLQDWLISRRIVPKNVHPLIKAIRMKITNAVLDMPEHELLVKLLTGRKINYYCVQDIISILKQTEKDTKSLFGTYGSQRMKDWQEILRLYEKDNVYLAETAQMLTRNIHYEIPGIQKQMAKLEQQSDESLKRAQDLNKPESQLMAEHDALLQNLGVKGENLREEFLKVTASCLPDLYAKSIKNIENLQDVIDLYAQFNRQPQCLPILRHIIEYGNTTVYQYIHKEAPISIEEPAIKLNLSDENDGTTAAVDNEIDFSTDDNGGTSSTVSAEMIDLGELNLEIESGNESVDIDAAGGDIDWGIETVSNNAAEINFDIPIEEYGIVVEGVGMDGGIAKGDQAYTLLDSPTYRERFLDEIHELDSFLRLRYHELKQVDVTCNIMFSLIDNISTHDVETIRKFLTNVEQIIEATSDERTRHLFQLKHSPKYANLLAAKLKQMTHAVEKIRTSKEALRVQAANLRKQRLELNPILDELTMYTNDLQFYIEKDISKRYKNRTVHIIGGIH